MNAVFYFTMSFNYAQGSAARMGPAFFPKMVALLLAVVGVGVILSAIAPRATLEKLESWDLKGLLWIAGSVVMFGLLLAPPNILPAPLAGLAPNSFGLVIALCALVIVSSLASPEFGWLGATVNTIVLVLFCVGIFVYGINLQLPVWPNFH